VALMPAAATQVRALDRTRVSSLAQRLRVLLARIDEAEGNLHELVTGGTTDSSGLSEKDWHAMAASIANETGRPFILVSGGHADPGSFDAMVGAMAAVGDVRRVVAAAPRYLARRPRIEQPGDLVNHQIVAMTQFGPDSWSFPPSPGSCVTRTIHFTPRLVLNSVRGVIASAVEGCGITRAFSCQIAEHVRAGEFEILLADDEEPQIPVHLLAPIGRLSVPKARAFVDFTLPRLRSYFAHLLMDAEETATGSRNGNLTAERHVITAAKVSGKPRDVADQGRRHCVTNEPGGVSSGPAIPHAHPTTPRSLNQQELLTAP
jgi:hypothetical protein